MAGLRSSLKASGQIVRVIRCEQHPDRVLAGAHRLRALEREGVKPLCFDLDVDKRAEELGLGHDLTELVIRIESNVQRRVPTGERAEEFLQVARLLEKEKVLKADVAQRMVKILGFSESYVLSLLPPEYKHQEKAVSPGRPESVIPKITERSEEEEPPKRKPYSKGLSPSLKQNLVGEFTRSHTALVEALQYLRVPFKTEWRVPVQKWSCPKCHEQYGDMAEAEAVCPRDKAPLEQVQFKCDIFIQTNAGFAVSLEVEGEGSSSRDNEERERLLQQQGVRTAHVPNECADKFSETIAGLVMAFLTDNGGGQM